MSFWFNFKISIALLTSTGSFKSNSEICFNYFSWFNCGRRIWSYWTRKSILYSIKFMARNYFLISLFTSMCDIARKHAFTISFSFLINSKGFLLFLDNNFLALYWPNRDNNLINWSDFNKSSFFLGETSSSIISIRAYSLEFSCKNFSTLNLLVPWILNL